MGWEQHGRGWIFGEKARRFWREGMVGAVRIIE
jgi:hypothetical protein